MNCPRCTAEVEEGAEECPNCGAELDADSPEAYETPAGDADAELAEGKLVEVWSGEEESGCVGTCKDLRKAGIPFKVSQHRQQRGKYLDEHYRIGVPAEFTEQAKKLIEADEVDPEEIRAESAPEEGIDAGEEDDYDRRGDQGEAEVEIWSGDAADVGMIEMCLKENGIRAQIEDGEKGKKKISVKFEHEKKAKEIVRELKEGTPE